MRPALAAPVVLAAVLLLAGCGGDGGDGGSGSSVSGADLVGPFEAQAQQAYDDQGADRDDAVATEAGVAVAECFAVDAAGAQSIGEATGQDGEWTTGTDGELSGPPGEESLSCSLQRDGEPADLDVDLSTTALDRDGLVGILTERGYVEVDATGTDLDPDSVLVLNSEQGAGILAIWVDGGFRVSVAGTGLERDQAGAVLQAAVTAVSEHLEQ
ncbi:hypothetical protein GCM10023340_12800 [Nocardioides marinquilinus]|uniref:DUF3558 domain-containing protein n=1 Tax=Nocardioides marinquilinus TaxID=1210400 RepID=A0ABP9PDM9_9ACTN